MQSLFFIIFVKDLSRWLILVLMRYLLIILIFISAFCKGQQKASKIVDSNSTHFFGQISVGASFPVGNFPTAAVGAHADINVKYFIIPRIAAIAKAGYDINGLGTSPNPFKNIFPYSFQQYLGGICFRSNINDEPAIAGKSIAAPWFDLIALCGATIGGSLPSQSVYGYTYSSGIIASGESSSGSGSGFAYYIGGEFIIVTKHKKIISLGAGYLGSTIRYTNYTYNLTGLRNTPYAGATASIKSPQTYFLGEIQPYIGIGF